MVHYFRRKIFAGEEREKDIKCSIVYMVYSCECFPAVEAAPEGLATAWKREQVMSEGEDSVSVLSDDLNIR